MINIENAVMLEITNHRKDILGKVVKDNGDGSFKVKFNKKTYKKLKRLKNKTK